MKLFKPLTTHQVVSKLDGQFQKILEKNRTKPLQIRVFSHKLGIDYSFPPGSANQPYHVASIGKLFTATLIQILADRRLLSTQGTIQPYFSAGELEGLFVYQGVNYAGEVTIEHLLGHTSGIADYFEGSTKDGTSFIDGILSNPNQHWVPLTLLDYTRENQAAVGKPGSIFNYSDTGYILLGLLVEKVTGSSFGENLEKYIFHPSDMRDSYLMFYTKPLNEPKKDIERIWFNNIEISSFESLSCDWAGGGIVSTTADLLKFNLALRTGEMIPANFLVSMDSCNHKFRQGIYYGLGMMEIRFGEFLFLLGRLPKIKGHIGILSTHLFYDHTIDAHIVMNFGSNTRMVDSFRALIGIENLFQRMR